LALVYTLTKHTPEGEQGRRLWGGVSAVTTLEKQKDCLHKLLQYFKNTIDISKTQCYNDLKYKEALL